MLSSATSNTGCHSPATWCTVKGCKCACACIGRRCGCRGHPIEHQFCVSRMFLFLLLQDVLWTEGIGCMSMINHENMKLEAFSKVWFRWHQMKNQIETRLSSNHPSDTAAGSSSTNRRRRRRQEAPGLVVPSKAA